jgi:hypothetical protein
MPLFCGLSTGVVLGSSPISQANPRVSAGDAAATIVREPFRNRQTVDQVEAVLDSLQHEVADVVTRDAARRGREAHGLSVTAVEGEGDLHLLAIVAADLEAVRAPASVRLVHCNTAARTHGSPSWPGMSPRPDMLTQIDQTTVRKPLAKGRAIRFLARGVFERLFEDLRLQRLLAEQPMQLPTSAGAAELR